MPWDCGDGNSGDGDSGGGGKGNGNGNGNRGKPPTNPKQPDPGGSGGDGGRPGPGDGDGNSFPCVTPMCWMQRYNKWALGKLTQGAQNAVDDYAQTANDPNSNWLAQAAANVGGSLAMLATKEHIDTTVLVLGAGYMAGNVAKAVELKAVCFATGTLVLTGSGYISIEQIKAGQSVRARNAETGEISSREVLELVVKHTHVLVHLQLENGVELLTTEEHPFRRNDTWTPSAALTAGDIVETASGTTHVVSTSLVPGDFAVYNLNVDEDHTYFVTESKVFVHNNNCYRANPNLRNITDKIRSQMPKRGWTEDDILEAFNKGEKNPAVNRLSGGTPATRYTHPTTGQYVVIDDATGNIIQVGGPGFIPH